MCGIAGICNFGDKPNQSIVKSMTKKLTHRGPDDEAYFLNNHVSFGHTRLSIIDLENSQQPMIDQNTKNILIFNGEIYNFLELKNELVSAGYKFKTNGDTEVVLKAYNKWGADCLDKFEGMFALAIWDNNKEQLFIARDRFGEKPLFYQFSQKYGFIFSSEMKSFLINEIKEDLHVDFSSLNTYLSLNYLISNKTFFKNVHLLEPASYIVVNRNNFKNVKSIKYWFLEKYFNNKIKDSYKDAQHKLDGLIKKSVELRMISDVSNGTFLSGGIDSSIISLQLKNINNHKMKAHNFSFEEKKFDEFKDAKKVADFLGIEIFKHNTPLQNNFVNDFPKIIDAMDQPMSDTSFLPTYYLSKFSSENSKMILSGDGSDELFCGYSTYMADYIKRFTPSFPAKYFHNLLKFFNIYKNNNLSKVGLGYRVSKFLSALEHQSLYSHVLWREIFTLKEKTNLVNEDFKKYMNYDFLQYFKNQNELVSELNYLDRFMYIDFKSWLPNDILYKIDRATMSNSQEARTPYLDRNLVEYVSSMPVNYKFEMFNRKKILKDTFKHKLPKTVFAKKKSGFNAPIGIWLIENKKIRDMAYDLINTNKMYNIFNKKELNKIWNNHQERNFDESFKIFNLICFSQWIENNNLNIIK
ncbi:asparagine synthase (glutamine-hydrolyzing) [Candidatus Pelagibacter bacterium]|nr:asparagine synthase (glutamine-hydrolyzing) [Candidatus Pelagibacter bacterium]